MVGGRDLSRMIVSATRRGLTGSVDLFGSEASGFPTGLSGLAAW